MRALGSQLRATADIRADIDGGLRVVSLAGGDQRIHAPAWQLQDQPAPDEHGEDPVVDLEGSRAELPLRTGCIGSGVTPGRWAN